MTPERLNALADFCVDFAVSNPAFKEIESFLRESAVKMKQDENMPSYEQRMNYILNGMLFALDSTKTVELGPKSLQTLVAAMYVGAGVSEAGALKQADSLLASLDKKAKNE